MPADIERDEFDGRFVIETTLVELALAGADMHLSVVLPERFTCDCGFDSSTPMGFTRLSSGRGQPNGQRTPMARSRSWTRAGWQNRLGGGCYRSDLVACVFVSPVRLSSRVDPTWIGSSRELAAGGLRDRARLDCIRTVGVDPRRSLARFSMARSCTVFSGIFSSLNLEPCRRSPLEYGHGVPDSTVGVAWISSFDRRVDLVGDPGRDGRDRNAGE